jgi:Flp pilus assembly protein TadG
MLPERARRFLLCDHAATAVEFALVTPAFLALVLGGISVCVLLYSNVSLQDAAEKGARCYSVDSGTCGSASAAQTYAQGFYHGVGAPTFTASTPACGHQVAAAVTLQIAAVVANLSVPLSGSACFP